MLRRTELRVLPPPDRRSEPGYREWHEPVFGNCAVCGEGPQRLERHHVIHAQHVRITDPAKEWDRRNSMLVGAHCARRCHARHTSAAQRIPVSAIPPEAIEFAIELLGAEAADAYLERYYSTG